MAGPSNQMREDPKPCGGCSLCCKLMGVEAIAKPADIWCRHFAKGVGCAIYAERPGACRAFQCLWSLTDGLGEEWRPDRSKLVLSSDADGRVIVEVDPATPSAWRREPYHSVFRTWSDARKPLPLQVLVRVNNRILVVFPETEIEIGPYRPDMRLDVGYRDGAPFAEWAAPMPR
jgi:hypothetical protein